MTLQNLLQALAVGAVLSLPGCTDSSPAFDIPALIGKDIAEVRSVLGQPSGEPDEAYLQDALRDGVPNAYWMWERDGWWLSVNVDIKKRRPTSYQLTPKNGSLKDLADAMAAGNLTETSGLYRIRPTFSRQHPGRYTGVFITPR